MDVATNFSYNKMEICTDFVKNRKYLSMAQYPWASYKWLTMKFRSDSKKLIKILNT